jgi:hypothetical protein
MKPMPELGRCPYCGRKLDLYRAVMSGFRTNCWNDHCPTNRYYETERGAINAANRRAK